MPIALIPRAKHVYEVLVCQIWSLSWGVTFGVAGGLLTWRDELLPEEIKDKWRVLIMLPHWSWGWWVLVTSMMMLAVILEASFRVRRHIEHERDATKSEVADLKAAGPDLIGEISHIFPRAGRTFGAGAKGQILFTR